MENFINYNNHETTKPPPLNKERRKGGGSKLSTDPQSVAARERRHRISDRFRVLKSMVPGGSKMDTASMLEEAIHYVKFLKSQIWLHQAAIVLQGTEDCMRETNNDALPLSQVISSNDCSMLEGNAFQVKQNIDCTEHYGFYY